MASHKFDPVETCKSIAFSMLVIGCIGHVTIILNVGSMFWTRGAYVLIGGAEYKSNQFDTSFAEMI